MKQPNIVPEHTVAPGAETVPHEFLTGGSALDREPETAEEAEAKGPSAAWTFWNQQIAAALTHEKLFRAEGEATERMYFGRQEKTYTDGESESALIKIDEKTALIHANVDVLKPLIYSDTPQPVVRRRFNGDFKTDETDLMATEAVQRLANYLIDVEDFDGAMIGCRDDWLIPGRGNGTVVYKEKHKDVAEPVLDLVSGQPVIDPATGLPATKMVSKRINQRVLPRHREWRTMLFCPNTSWEDLPWLAIEHSLTRSTIEKRFGADKAAKMSFNRPGLANSTAPAEDDDKLASSVGSVAPTTDTLATAISPFDTAPIMEIWDRESMKVIWWSSCYPDDVLDAVDDPLGLDDFFPCPRPLLATTKGRRLTPRPDIRYYEQRAEECRIATEKMTEILNVIAVAGLIPASATDEFKKLFEGKNQLIPVVSWIAMLQKGNVGELVQWLPLAPMIQALQALQQMREQAKNAMFEASGVSDVMRAATDPNETAAAQNLKGRYSGLRLSERQRRMALFALDMLRMMIDVATGLFETELIAEICGMDLPLTEAERLAEIERRDQLMQAFQAQMALHQAGMQIAQAQQQEQAAMAQQQGGMMPPGQPAPPPEPPLDPGPPPEEPKFDKKVPETSWELVHARIKSDFKRKITISIETESTVLADEASDKQSRVEFIQAFASFVQTLLPLVGTGQMPMATMKEMLLFGIRGFPKSRSLETLIADLPDELPTPEAKEEASITVAKIRAEVDKLLQESEQAHELKMKGVDLIAEAAHGSLKDAPAPDLPPDPTPKTPSKGKAK